MKTNANATNDSESNTHIRDTLMAITLRPCEYKVCTLGKKRQQYYKYTLEEQKEILLSIIYHCELKGLIFTDLFYEITELKGSLAGNKTIHFHADLEICCPATYQIFKDHVLLINNRYGPKSYTALDYKILFTNDDHERWKIYKRKDIKHSFNEWTKGI